MRGALYLVTLSSAGIFLLLVPAILISLAGGETALALQMGLIGSLGAFFATMVLAALAGRIGPLERELNFVSLVLVWVATPMTAAICLMVLAGLGPMQAWFEGVSALTTAGATVLPRDTLPGSVLFWRSSLEWYGGFLILISIIHVLAPAGFGGIRASGRRRGAGGKRDGDWGALGAYSSVFWQYGVLTLCVALGLLLAGVGPARAFMLAMMSISTGGFLPFDGPLEDEIGGGAVLVLAVGLCFGTLSIFWRRNILRNPQRMLADNREAVIVFAAILALALIYAGRIADAGGARTIATVSSALLEGFFTAASLVATSGIETRPGVIALLPDFAVLTVVLIGASVYSTTGGLKVYRVATMWVYAKAELNRLIFPSGVSSLKFGRQQVDDHAIRAVWAYFVLALFCVAGGTVAIAATAADFEGGLALAVTFFSGATPAYEAIVPAADTMEATSSSGWPAIGELRIGALLPAIVLMTIGRLEVLIVFAVINVRYWLGR